MAIEIHPLTPDRWRDFAALMEARFDTRHCWCMAPRANHRQRTGAQNRQAMKKVVDTAAAPPGLLAYVDGKVVGWCAVAPRDEFARVPASLRSTDAPGPIWSVVCFSVLRPMRRQGLSRRLLEAAIQLAGAHGAAVIEGYPTLEGRNQYRGVAAVFREAGFEEIPTANPNRPLMRYTSRRQRSPTTRG